MTRYVIEFEGKLPEYGLTELDAANEDQADDFTREYIYETYPDLTDVQIVSIKEVK